MAACVAPSALARGSRSGFRVHDGDRAGSRAGRELGEEETHRARAVDQVVVGEPHLQLVEAAHRARQRLDDRAEAALDIGRGARTRWRPGTETNSAQPPSTVTPIAFQFSHRFPRPSRQKRQTPQYSDGSTHTKSPCDSPVTSRPTATTSPANSCPGTIG